MTPEVVEFKLQAHVGNDEWTTVGTADNFDELYERVVWWMPNTTGVSVKDIEGWAWVKRDDLRIVMIVTVTHVCHMPAVLGCAGVE